MSIREEIKVLRGIPPFADLAAKKLELLAYMSERLTFEAGDALVRQGDAGDAVFIVLDGVIDVTVGSSGDSSHVREMGQYAFIGEIAVLNRKDRTATVTAKTGVSALKISRETLLKMIDDVPDLGDRIAEHMTKAGYVFG